MSATNGLAGGFGCCGSHVKDGDLVLVASRVDGLDHAACGGLLPEEDVADAEGRDGRLADLRWGCLAG